MQTNQSGGRGDILESLSGHVTRRWINDISLTATVGVIYFAVAYLSLTGLFFLKPEGVAVFWPAAGVSSGILIALGPRARWPVAVGVMAAVTLVVRFVMEERDIWIALIFALCDVAEPIIIAGLIQRYFGAHFTLDQLRNVLGLIIATVVACIMSSFGAAVASRLLLGPSAPIFTVWPHWFASVAVGVVIVAPLVIGFIAALHEPPPRSELTEGTVALAALAAMTATVIFLLPQQLWETVVPGAMLFPMLLWLAARCRPVFAAAGSLMVSLTVAWTPIFGIGHFGDTGLSIDYRILQAQAIILGTTIGAYVLAALFAERRKSELRLSHANMLLERERDNKLMNALAITAAIAHEIRQPLGAIMVNAGAALRFLERAPPDHNEAQAALKRIKSDSDDASEVFDTFRALFGKVDQRRQLINVNEIILEVLASFRGELQDHNVETHTELAPQLPLVNGHRNQLREVILNLVHNAVEAMDATTGRNRVLSVKTALRGQDAIIVSVKDSGPGIDPEQLNGIFGAFVTTKAHGTGLGLAICRMIIEHHDGQILASSDGKNGATFQFALPIGSTDKDAARVKDTTR